jgi:tetratricopeptide (TPR) repeat protein
MDDTLPVIYLSGLLIFVGGLAIFVLFQIIKTRRFESRFDRLQKKLQQEKGTAQEYYELASMFLNKKLYTQAINLLQKALKVDEEIAPENKAMIYNALGFAYFAQEQYELAIRNYKDAIKYSPQYVIAINNLANIYEKKQMTAKALETYEESLKHEPNNSVAKRRAEALRKRFIAQS